MKGNHDGLDLGRGHREPDSLDEVVAYPLRIYLEAHGHLQGSPFQWAFFFALFQDDGP